VAHISVLDVNAMENHPWQKRARKAGLTQKVLAKLLGHAEITVSRQLRGHWESGVPMHVRAAIIAWELMTPELRKSWLAAIEREMKRRDRQERQ